MIKNFGNKTASDLFHNGKAKLLPEKYWQRAIDLLDVMEAVYSLDDLKAKGFPHSFRLHKLKGSRKEEYVIDIHKIDGRRITFKFDANEFVEVKTENCHK